MYTDPEMGPAAGPAQQAATAVGQGFWRTVDARLNGAGLLETAAGLRMWKRSPVKGKRPVGMRNEWCVEACLHAAFDDDDAFAHPDSFPNATFPQPPLVTVATRNLGLLRGVTVILVRGHGINYFCSSFRFQALKRRGGAKHYE